MEYLHEANEISDTNFDIVIFINDQVNNLGSEYQVFENALNEYKKFNPLTDREISLVPFSAHPQGRLIFSPISSLNNDYDDSRRIYDSTIAAVKRVVKLGMKRPLLVLGPCHTAPKDDPAFQRDSLIATMILGAFYATYLPIETREFRPNEPRKVLSIGVLKGSTSTRILENCKATEEGRRVARDIGGGDPERMAPPRVAEYVQAEFASHSDVIKVNIDLVNEKEFPLMAAVNRASKHVPRHDGRVITLEYNNNDKNDEDTTLYFIGKGITFDTGGADVKINSGMMGMHRDKAGAAAVVGFFKVLALLKPKGLRVKGFCAFVRNNIGEEAYVQDEIVISRAGRRIRIGNTDAEGRMVMADLLCKAKEEALQATNPLLFTVATLTGHAVLTYGPHYTAVMCNGSARKLKVDHRLQENGTQLAEPVEISRIRREDMDFHRLPDNEYADILQCNEKPSSQTARGHMTPAGFLQLASGLDQHGLNSTQPLPYTHIDCAGSSGLYPHVLIPTGAPLLTLASTFVFDRL